MCDHIRMSETESNVTRVCGNLQQRSVVDLIARGSVEAPSFTEEEVTYLNSLFEDGALWTRRWLESHKAPAE